MLLDSLESHIGSSFRFHDADQLKRLKSALRNPDIVKFNDGHRTHRCGSNEALLYCLHSLAKCSDQEKDGIAMGDLGPFSWKHQDRYVTGEGTQ